MFIDFPEALRSSVGILHFPLVQDGFTMNYLPNKSDPPLQFLQRKLEYRYMIYVKRLF